MEKFTGTEDIIKAIKKTMIETDTTQVEISKELGIKPQSLTSLMKKKNFSFLDAEKILSIMGCGLYFEIRKKD